MMGIDPSVAARLVEAVPHDRLPATFDEMAGAAGKPTVTALSPAEGTAGHVRGPGPVPAADGGDLAALAVLWVDDRLRRGQISAKSAQMYLDRLMSFLRLYPGVAELDRSAMIAWQRSIAHLSQSSRRAYVGAVGRFVRWLHVEGYVSADLSAHLAPVREPRSVPRALAAAEAAQLLEACRNPAAPSREGVSAAKRRLVVLRDEVIVWLMLECGLRCMEVSGLNLDDYDPDAATIFVHGKGGHERVLPVPTAARAMLDAYLTERGYRPGPLLEGVGTKSNPDGRLSAKSISKRLGQIMTRAGVHRPGDGKSAHALRHTAASDVLDRCLDLRVVQQMLGHASLATTERYLRRADLGRLRAAMEGRAYEPGSQRPGTSQWSA